MTPAKRYAGQIPKQAQMHRSLQREPEYAHTPFFLSNSQFLTADTEISRNSFPVSAKQEASKHCNLNSVRLGQLVSIVKCFIL